MHSFKCLLLFCLVVVSTTCLSQTSWQIKIAPALLKSDFVSMRDSLQKLHPGLYRYKSKSFMDHVFDSCYHAIKDSMTVPQFFFLTSFAIASMEDGHSNCRMPSQIVNDIISSDKIFPAMVMFIHDRLFIYCCKQN